MQTENNLYDLEMEMNELRIIAEENQRDLTGRCYQRDYTRIPDSENRREDGMGSFFLRTSLSLLIFCGFLWLQRENRSILGVTPDAVTEVISQSIPNTSIEK